MTSYRLLVISNCSGDKAVKTPAALNLDDFADPERLAHREHGLAPLQRPAATMYVGQQHNLVMRGVEMLSRAFGGDFVDHWIISAGYGLIHADRPICPYNARFKHVGGTRAQAAWANRLGVPRDVRTVLQGVELGILLLDSEYVDAIHPPVAATAGQRLVVLAKPSKLSQLRGDGVVCVPTGKSEAASFGSRNLRTVKGEMFERFAQSLVRRHELFAEIKADQSSATFLNAVGR
jgi:hypothetical protein